MMPTMDIEGDQLQLILMAVLRKVGAVTVTQADLEAMEPYLDDGISMTVRADNTVTFAVPGAEAVN